MPRTSSLILATHAIALITLSAACKEASSPSPDPVTLVTIDGGPRDASPDPAPTTATTTTTPPPDASQPDFYACNVDADCIAVPKVGCCNNGYKEAVNKASAEAYKLSFTCPTPNQICPHYMINDVRLPECKSETHRCEMVAPDQIKCGGFIKNQHACPDGMHCVLPKTPDKAGSCQK
jgi:hypothetical protein